MAIGKSVRCESEQTPLPKSSRATATPAAASRSKRRHDDLWGKRQTGRTDFHDHPFLTDLRLLESLKVEVWKRVQLKGFPGDIDREVQAWHAARRASDLAIISRSKRASMPASLASGEEVAARNLGGRPRSKSRQRFMKLRLAIRRTHDRLDPDFPGIEIEACREISEAGAD